MSDPDIPLPQVLKLVNDAVKRTGEHCDAQLATIRVAIGDVKDHVNRRLEREIGPLRKDIESLMAEVIGKGDAQLGLVRKLDAVKADYVALDRRVGEVESERDVTMNDLHGGRRMAGNLKSSGGRDKSESERPRKSDDVQVSVRLPRWALYLILAGFVGGPTAFATMYGIINQTPQEVVDVQAEGVATMQAQASEKLEEARVATVEAVVSNERMDEREADLERRERALQAREIELNVESQRAQDIPTDGYSPTTSGTEMTTAE